MSGSDTFTARRPVVLEGISVEKGEQFPPDLFSPFLVAKLERLHWISRTEEFALPYHERERRVRLRQRRRPVDITEREAVQAKTAVGSSGEQQTARISEPHLDPAAVSVSDVLVYLADHPDEAADILKREVNGRNRRSLVSALEAMVREG